MMIKIIQWLSYFMKHPLLLEATFYYNDDDVGNQRYSWSLGYVGVLCIRWDVLTLYARID